MGVVCSMVLLYAIIIRAASPPNIALDGDILTIIAANVSCPASESVVLTLGSCEFGVVTTPIVIFAPTNTCKFVEDVPDDFIAALTIQCIDGTDSSTTEYILHLTIITEGSAVPPRDIPGYGDPTGSAAPVPQKQQSVNLAEVGGLVGGLVVLGCVLIYYGWPKPKISPQGMIKHQPWSTDA